MNEADEDRAASDLRVALGRVVRRLRQAHEPGELTLSEVSVLSRLDRDGPATPGALAGGERVRPQAMGTTLAALEQRGLVARMPDPDDGRRVSMSITEDGRGILLDRRSASVRRLSRALTEGFSPEERRRLIECVPLLDRLADSL
ncbi:MarR family winged helix-turn-helix transcriptional regulator [Actinoallomurus iriomotensis]|uniref:MarR family transcriptional regulator n=1 Tax=Actinoallomurus iriomotensis TaxID=478107 RepID=A0A9W6RIU3_9ACTN|nr:MarR family transcriptional regulator [Actinoallomurus iriomotensis]GLY76498.1 MarR family transcriptional regulator [Actinoallomurus iriomotensis]